MPRLSRRFLAIGITASVLVIAVAAMQRREPPVHRFRVELGLQDKQPAQWNGEVKVAGGEVVALEGWRFQNKDRVLDKNKWRCETRNFIVPGKRFAINTAKNKPRVPTPEETWPNGVTIAVKGDNPKITLKLKQGEVQFTAGDFRFGEPKMFLQEQVRVIRMPQSVAIRPPSEGSPKSPDAYQDDYPAFCIDHRSGKQYLAWVSYHRNKDRVLMTWRQGGDGAWQKPMIAAPSGHHFRVALAATRDGKLWIVWSSQKEYNWDLYCRQLQKGRLGKTIRLTNSAGPDIWHRMTTDNRGRAWLVWQGFRNGQSDIFARCADGDGWHDPIKVSDSAGNDWDPCITSDTKNDRVWIGWDTYHNNNYGARVRGVSGGTKPKLESVMTPEPSPLFQAHVSLASDSAGRLWAAWDESGPQWGKDTGFLYGGQNRKDTSRLYSSRRIRIKVFAGNKWLEPKQPFETCLPNAMQEYNDYPKLQTDKSGRVWLAFRQRTCIRPREDGWAARGRWDVYATAYLGDRWLSPTPLPDSGGRNDMRADSQADADGNVYFACATDNRAWFPSGMLPRNHSIAVSKLNDAPPAKKIQLLEKKRKFPVIASCHPLEKEQVARIRKYKIEAAGKTYHIYRGDLHRHTDISTDGIGDGSLMDLHRYAHDAAMFDYIMVGDHNMGNDNEYCWWRTQHSNDLYTVPGKFISMYGYERSVRYPRGHRNVIWAKRGHRTLALPKPVPAAFGRDTERLYAYLRQTEGICTSHTSASSQGTDWKDKIDPKLEPIVEIFQGFHAAYEAPGAPKSFDAKMDRIHNKFEPAGYISNALAKGYKLGLQASSDHISTHVSYACIIAEDFTRQGLINAMRKRHTYAATDNIIMDVRMGNNIMGDEVTTRQPKLDIAIIGTGPIDRIEILRNNEVVHTNRPKNNTDTAKFSWEDSRPLPGRVSFYYVRIIQRDGQMAWASPIWVKL